MLKLFCLVETFEEQIYSAGSPSERDSVALYVPVRFRCLVDHPCCCATHLSLSAAVESRPESSRCFAASPLSFPVALKNDHVCTRDRFQEQRLIYT